MALGYSDHLVCVRAHERLYTSQRQREKEVMFFERERSETKRVFFFLHIVPVGHKAGPVQKGSDGALSARAAAVPGVNVSDI